jgi:hypothetical protein
MRFLLLPQPRLVLIARKGTMTPLLLFPVFNGLDGRSANHASRGTIRQREILDSRSD